MHKSDDIDFLLKNFLEEEGHVCHYFNLENPDYRYKTDMDSPEVAARKVPGQFGCPSPDDGHFSMRNWKTSIPDGTNGHVHVNRRSHSQRWFRL